MLCVLSASTSTSITEPWAARVARRGRCPQPIADGPLGTVL